MAILTHAMTAGFALVMLAITVINQGVGIVNGARDHIAALTAIAAIGATKFNKFFPPKAKASRPALTALDKYLCLIQKFHWCSI
jgi:hypothetical protein